MDDVRARVVLVDDTAADAELISQCVSNSPLRLDIHRVQDERGLRDALRTVRPHVILSDFSLASFAGLEALRIAKELAPDVPFIFVCGALGEERAIDALRRGASDCVLKGNLSRLGGAVERALHEARLRASQRAAEQRLRDNERRLRDTVEASQDWIWELDAQGRFRFSSGAVRQILGYQPAELLGQSFRAFLHEQERHRAGELLPPPGRGELTGAVAGWRAADGQLRWLERNAVSIVSATGELTGYRGSDRDITARREQEERLRRLTRTYRMLSHTSSAILRLHDRMDLLEQICRIAVEQGGYERVVISLNDPASGLLQPRASAGADSPALRSFDRTAFERAVTSGAAVHPVHTGATMLLNDLRTERPDLSGTEVLTAHGYRGFAALPVLIDGTTVGVITLFSRRHDVFDRAEVEVLLELSANLGFALQYLQRDEAVHFLSYFDSLTGLAKRALFCQRLEHLLGGRAEKADELPPTRAVLVFDVQQLGAINDSFGRYVGDQVIEQIAARLKQAHGGEMAAHFGGGTFAVLLPQAAVGSTGQTTQLLQNAASRLFVEPFEVEGHQLRPAVRTGIAYWPHDADSADALVQNAEAALKAAREDSERYMVYALVRHRPTSRHLALEARLAGALSRNEFLLHYQPKIELASGRVEGLEALLRWQDAHEALVPPSLFVPLLERSGAIAEVGEWVLQQAAADVVRWRAAGLGTIRAAVNVSPLQLRRRDFVERVLGCIRQNGAQAACVDLEITESMLMQDFELSMRKLAELREAGIEVAIDDFGTGYSSLRLLSRLPVDTLKIDRSFIQSLADASTAVTLVSTIVSLARALDLKSVAEGVETPEQLRLLRQVECHQAQGYLFARPVPAQEIPAVIARLAPRVAVSEGVRG